MESIDFNSLETNKRNNPIEYKGKKLSENFHAHQSMELFVDELMRETEKPEKGTQIQHNKTHRHQWGKRASTIIESGLNEAKYIQLQFNYSKA